MSARPFFAFYWPGSGPGRQYAPDGPFHPVAAFAERITAGEKLRSHHRYRQFPDQQMFGGAAVMWRITKADIKILAEKRLPQE